MEFSFISILLPAIVGSFLFQRLPIAMKILVVSILVNLGFELIAYVMFLSKMNNMVLFHLQTVIEFGLLSVVYFFIFKSYTFKRIIKYLTVITLGLGLVNLLFEDFEAINSFPRILEGLILIFYFLSYYSLAITKDKIPYLELSPYFVLTSGLLLYFSGMVILNFVSEDAMKTSLISIWTAHSLLNIMLNIIYTIVLWKGSKVSKLL